MYRPLTPDRYSDLIQLRDKVEHLEEENRYLRECLYPSTPPMYRGLKLTAKESLLLESLLSARSVCTRDYAMNRLYRNIDEQPEGIKILDVFIHNLRAKLHEINIDVETIWGRGWRLSDENKEKLKAMEVEMTDPFVKRNSVDHAKASREQAAKEVIARDARIEAAAKARNAPKEPVSKAYPYPQPIWKL